ncbi:hypothetical protein [Streptomyces brasiliensis]|uniref:Uncharacterized protein n=1 Tax=Streptomyces brasiliensis TaxID=1954 RepID=A0A917PDL0_9ACTN|nr:hypothetical protein [Streptomyces brasiliensis]GGJ71974.1 hypothetical protein GCM10010121_098150 [Streptomyces brasiliensis]
MTTTLEPRAEATTPVRSGAALGIAILLLAQLMISVHEEWIRRVLEQ